MTVQEMIDQLTKLVKEQPECGEYELIGVTPDADEITFVKTFIRIFDVDEVVLI